MSAETASPTIDEDDNSALSEALGLSPDRFCWVDRHSDDKLVVLDHSEPMEYGHPKVSTIKKPSFVDNLSFGSILQPNPSSRKFYAYGGDRDVRSTIERDLTYIAPSPENDPKGRIFMYDFATQKWKKEMVGVTQLVQAQSTNDPLRGVSYVLDGYMVHGYDMSEMLEAGRLLEALEIERENSHKGLLEFDPIDLSFRNISHSNNEYEGFTVEGYLEYLPFGQAGVLIKWGGQHVPFYGNGAEKGMNPMTEVDIYDIASNTWFKQQTYTQSQTGEEILATGLLNNEARSPKIRDFACSVVKPAPDLSSYNIYMYGGSFSNDAWVLSVPSFTWIKLWEATDDYVSYQSRCVEYGNYLIIVGGWSALPDKQVNRCKDFLRWLDLSTGEMVTKWKGKAAKEDAYSIPEAVFSVIGGNGNGGATFRKPPKAWTSPELAKIFSQTPDPEAMANWRPKSSTDSGSSKTSTSKTDPLSNSSSGNSSKVPTAAIAGGIIGGLAALAIIIFLVYFIRKRRRQNSRVNSALDEHQAHHEIDGHLRKRDEMVYQEMEGASNLRHELQSSKYTPAAAMVQGDWVPSELAGFKESEKRAQVTYTPERVVYELDAGEIPPRIPSPPVK
ncbi:hypothetical protein EX30DRAFT_361589 [Ascodesmis nigricans]|uniref:Kelch repeat protein n=1 Tax=Ascodesmis nigricans TaxID=341454 RepID=A0A4S2N2T2_9PEZI|nr:hypothetical protein EX30DRAFT_361589 [Ascodesmis nigricans]